MILFKKVLKYITTSLFSIKSLLRLAVAGSFGVFIGSMGLKGYSLGVIFAVSLVFRLNILPLMLGILIGMMTPVLALLPSTLVNSNVLPIQIAAGLAKALIFFLVFIFCSSHIKQKESENKKNNFIFVDQSGIRYKFFKSAGIFFIIIVIITSVVFGQRLVSNPHLDEIQLEANGDGSYTELSDMKIKEKVQNRQLEVQNSILKYSLDKVTTNNSGNVYAYYTNDNNYSEASLRNNIKQINTVIPNWLHIDKNMLVTNTAENNIDKIAKDNNIKIMPMVDVSADGTVESILIHEMLSSSDNRSKVITELLKLVEGKYDGININFIRILPEDKSLFTVFMSELYSLFNFNELTVTITIRPNPSAYDYSNLEKYVDYAMIIAYNEQNDETVPGPIAPENLITESIKSINFPVDKSVISLGNYGYQWATGTVENDEPIAFCDLMDLCASQGIEVQWDSASKNPYIKYSRDGTAYTAWFLDGSTFYNELRIALENNINNVALCNLGMEDTTVWDVLKNMKTGDMIQSLKALIDLKAPEWIKYNNAGDLVRIVSGALDGSREIQIDSKGFITTEKIDSIPIPMKANRYGWTSSKKIVLTFDDGPDSRFTPQILDILKKYNVKATFFTLGINAVIQPSLLQRIYNEGHEIGNHTFTHPKIAQEFPLLTQIQLNANQRLIQTMTGHSTSLFRPPYNDDKEASTKNEIEPILEAQNMGYTLISQGIDPMDYKASSADQIVNEIIQQLGKGNIILLHDSGGDRTTTVKALPMIIESLQAQGYTFTTLSELIGLDREKIMPVVDEKDKTLMVYDKIVFTWIEYFHRILFAIFMIAIILGSVKLIFFLLLAVKQKFKEKKLCASADYRPLVSIIIPTYNEEKVICKNILSILNSDYENIEIIVVDDGSKDNSSKVVREGFLYNPKVKLICKTNGGKASALNTGIKYAKGEIIVAIDADTIIKKNSISLMVKHFSNNEIIAAVSGNVKVGNIHNLATLFQHIEYVTGFNLERRAFDELNCVTVVPGAIGAWRKEALVKAGGYKEDTLAEDTDITLTLLMSGYRIKYESRAHAYTESPDSFKSLAMQRYRWTYGTLQCLWKHKEALLNPKYKALGIIAMPNMWIFQYIFMIISPIIDIYFAISLLSHDPMRAVKYYFMFMLLDYFVSIAAFLLDKEKLAPLLVLFIQRIIYRMFMIYVIYQSVDSALKGKVVLWNKLKREGNVDDY